MSALKDAARVDNDGSVSVPCCSFAVMGKKGNGTVWKIVAAFILVCLFVAYPVVGVVCLVLVLLVAFLASRSGRGSHAGQAGGHESGKRYEGGLDSVVSSEFTGRYLGEDGLPVDYVALDTETTGLHADRDRIIEIGAVKVRGRQVVDRFSMLVDPGCVLDARIVELTGITDSMLKGQPGIVQALPAFWSWVGDDPLVGHNLHFDMGFLEAEGDRIGVEGPEGVICMDTLQMSRAMFPEERHHRLEDLIRRFGIAQSEEHRALSDAEQTQQCFEWMRDYMRRQGGGFSTVVSDGGAAASREVGSSPAASAADQSRHFGGHDLHRPCNKRPDGDCIVENVGSWQTVGVAGAGKHQDVFTRFPRNAEVWVTLTHGIMPSGTHAGEPVIDVWLDGEYAGYLTVLQTSRHCKQVPPQGGVSYAHFGATGGKGKLQLRVSFPYAHAETDYKRYAQTLDDDGRVGTNSPGIQPSSIED